MKHTNIYPTSRRLHPLIALAAVAVLIASVVVAAAVTGVLPTAFSKTTPEANHTQPSINVQAGSPTPPAAPTQPNTRQSIAKPPQSDAVSCVLCGVVESVRIVQLPNHSTGLGALGGAVAGGVIGNQFGSGGGRTAMTLLGALGGGLAGNSVERNMNTQAVYKVRVRMENGYRRTFTYHSAPPYQPGDRVRVLHGSLSRVT